MTIVFLTWAYTRTFGPLDTYPRIQQTTESADGNWKFEVYQRKLALLNPLADSEIVFRIMDLRENRLYEQRIWRIVGAWGIKGNGKYDVRFEKDVIIVNEFWVVRKNNLKFEMCPLLACLGGKSK